MAMTMRGLFLWLAAPVLCLWAAAAEPFPFDPAAGRTPNPGEWLEYVVAYPVDPLENSLAPNPLPGIAEDGGTAAPAPLPRPSFEPGEAWRTVPVRLEVLSVANGVMRVRVRMSDRGGEIDIPLTSGVPADFHYEDPQPAPEQATQRVDGRAYEVTTLRRNGDGYGFARMNAPEFPFGLGRFATRDVDLILVGMGEGNPPAFPLPPDEISPPPGMFYREE